MGNVVGSTMKIDSKTEKAQRGKFAKIAVAVDLTKPLKGVVRLDEEDIQVSYEGLPTICYICGRIDHSSLACPLRQPIMESVNPSGPADASPEPVRHEKDSKSAAGNQSSGTLKLGEWMNVSTRPRRNWRRPMEGHQANSGTATAPFSYNKFDALFTEEPLTPSQP
ncbi:hypothetical protein Tsubulata_031818 [Turnera subulata]|uniref:Zinc knuckle CX2CX4HX4C domain-containing protein n=1 Tax=Turnera subulata TaxID=218843 RepID=A0A9Q0F8M6_9ROSI|nr:hypothetical protein Tsubulata_031818 [Turnera subulata]